MKQKTIYTHKHETLHVLGICPIRKKLTSGQSNLT